MPDKTAKKTLAGALAALGEGQFAMSEASVHVSLVFERNFDMPHAANFLPFKAWYTRSIVRVGQSEWDDIKILGHQLGHLISKFQASIFLGHMGHYIDRLKSFS